MTPYEKILGQILVMLVKEASGEIILTGDIVNIGPEEIVYIYNYEDENGAGFKLVYKDHKVVEEV